MKRVLHLALSLAAISAWLACAGNQPPPSPPPASILADIVRAHYDQACVDGRTQDAPAVVFELFDTTGLGSLLRSRFSQYAHDRDASLEFVSQYHRSGSLRAFGVWDFTTDSVTAIAVAEELRDRTRDLGRLLEPTGFRTRLEFSPDPALSTGPSILCEPHIVHGEGEPPTGLPDTVRLFSGRSSIRAGNDSTAEVRVFLNPRGEVMTVERRGGSEATFVEAERIVRQLRYDPALRNGEPVAGRTTQTLAFTRSTPLSPEEADSVFLARTGFELRSAAFKPILQVRRTSRVGFGLFETLKGLPDVRIEQGAESAQVFVEGGACPVAIRMNGVPVGDDDSVRLHLRVGASPTAFLTGVELYGPGAEVLTDSLGCGALLLWNRELADVVYEPLVGRVQGSIIGLTDEPGRNEVLVEPVGRITPVYRGGRFDLRGLLPGNYTVLIRRDSEVIGSETVRVTAGATVTLDIDLTSRR